MITILLGLFFSSSIQAHASSSISYLVQFKNKTACETAKSTALRHDFLVNCDGNAKAVSYYNFSYIGTMAIQDAVRNLRNEKSIAVVSKGNERPINH